MFIYNHISFFLLKFLFNARKIITIKYKINRKIIIIKKNNNNKNNNDTIIKYKT